MKQIISIILCMAMLFVIAAVPALAEDSGGEWVTLLSEDFGSYEEKKSFDEEVTYENAKSYVYYSKSPSGNVTNTVELYNGDKALKISRTADEGDSRPIFELKEHRTGQIEISFEMLATQNPGGIVNVEVFGETDGVFDAGNIITGTYFDTTKLYTHYNKTKKYTNDNKSWGVNDRISISYKINTITGDVTASYSCDGFSVEETMTEAESLPAVAGFGVRLGTAGTLESLYVDDILIKYYEEPAIEIDFDFSQISNESINGVTNKLNLINQFTDDEERLWYITWRSDNNEAIDDKTGTVTPGTIDERVGLTAIFTNSGMGGENEITFSRTFNVKVLAAGTYHLKEGFDASGDYSGLNAIASYPGDSEWNIGSNYGDTDKADDRDSPLNANISTDPENPQDKVLKLHRTNSGTTQRVWTRISSDASKFNEKMYVGMRVLRDTNGAHTDIYANAADGTRLMRVRFGTDDTITYQHGENLGNDGTSSIKAPSGKWFDFTIELDMKNGYYNVYIDGQSINTDALPMSVSGSGFGGLTFDVNRNSTEECIIYFDDLTMRTTDGMPYSIAEYNFTDADNNYPTHSMVEGGYLKYVKMRKMSFVDSETEPTLYLGFFKGEKLCDVVCAPLSGYSALGSFEVTLNEALPENPLGYTVKAFVFSKDLVPLMNPSTYEPYAVNPTIFVAGDSIAKSYSAVDYPMTGYAQVLSENFDENINIENHAEGSRSSRSFIAEGRLSKILEKMCSGDYLFIQFAHNDLKDKELPDGRYTDPKGDKDTEGSFKYYLMQYINGARDRGATPVLITSPASNEFDNGDGLLHDAEVYEYVTAMKSLADEEDVLLVDLYAGWKTFIDNRPEINGSKVDSKNYYMFLLPDDIRFKDDASYEFSQYNKKNIGTDNLYKSLYSAYIDDDVTNVVHVDGTHFNSYSARIAAQIIANGLKELNIGLSENIVDQGEIVCPWKEYVDFGTTMTYLN